MTEREYPRWVHGNGHESAIAHTEQEENALLAAWDAEDGRNQERLKNEMIASFSPTNALTAERSVVAEPRPKGKGGWPKGKPRTPKQLAVN